MGKRKAQVAKYALTDVFYLIRGEKVWFSAFSRSTDMVMKFYTYLGSPKSNEEANVFILNGILSLTPNDFYRRESLWGGQVWADAYGLIIEGHPWYIKFAISDDDDDDDDADEGAADAAQSGNVLAKKLLQQISFHPPEQAFVTTGGTSIPQGVQL